jgi:hypothetical protein
METLEGDRYKFSVVFGYGHTDWNVSNFFRLLEEEMTLYFGGCRVETKRGLWRADGNNETAPYTGELYEEDSVEVTIVTDVAPEKATRRIRAAARHSKNYTEGDVPMEWVNVEITQAQAAHFKM